MRRRSAVTGASGTAIPSPNIWHWPQVYEVENRAQDVDGAVFAHLRTAVDWTDADVVDVGCGAGFHLPMFAAAARSVTGVEPHPPLVAAARTRTAVLPQVRVLEGGAEKLPVADASVDLVHARTAYFFGPGCGPGILEAMRVLRPGGRLVVVDLDATAHPYGAWMRADLPQYDPAAVETFFDAQGFAMTRIDTRWEFGDRAALRAVLGIEFTARTATRAFEETRGTALEVRYRVHVRAKPAPGLLLPGS
ncbi:Methyltransferase domain-containing protein [Rhodococcus triatomae]|uniref:Methyltransferase domain-containing protein n=1 Tax=Rhodococcus triatomae TaxID=300028 RepID=A0A1G8Q362_9NOCA|nr:class I SAM-dependent methyltransferase [Rhodococcus triatomae]SDI99199.1 Methyltransferase domain-containing protein [Rhodococcus triatomae]